MSPKLVVEKSIVKEITFLRVVFFFLIIPLIILIYKIIEAKKEKVEFYEDYVIRKSGVFNIREERFSLVGITGVRVAQSFWGRIFGYGDIDCDLVGNKHLSLYGIKKPSQVKSFLQTNFIDAKNASITFVE